VKGNSEGRCSREVAEKMSRVKGQVVGRWEVTTWQGREKEARPFICRPRAGVKGQVLGCESEA
jgi:hypothetical protein